MIEPPGHMVHIKLHFSGEDEQFFLHGRALERAAECFGFFNDIFTSTPIPQTLLVPELTLSEFGVLLEIIHRQSFPSFNILTQTTAPIILNSIVKCRALRVNENIVTALQTYFCNTLSVLHIVKEKRTSYRDVSQIGYSVCELGIGLNDNCDVFISSSSNVSVQCFNSKITSSLCGKLRSHINFVTDFLRNIASTIHDLFGRPVLSRINNEASRLEKLDIVDAKLFAIHGISCKECVYDILMYIRDIIADPTQMVLTDRHEVIENDQSWYVSNIS